MKREIYLNILIELSEKGKVDETIKNIVYETKSINDLYSNVRKCSKLLTTCQLKKRKT